MKYKLQTLLSLVGLAVGFTCFALSVLWWRYETTYDAFHPEAENLYLQVCSTDKWVTTSPVTYYTAASEAMEKIPQVEQATVFRFSHLPLFIDESVSTKVMTVDSLFLPMLQPQLVAGSYPLMHPDESLMVVTDKLALKLFGTTDCIGKEVNLQLQFPETYKRDAWECGIYTVRAVVKDWGTHTLFPFDCLIPFKSAEIAKRTSPGENILIDYNCLMRLHAMADADTASVRIEEVSRLGSMNFRIVLLKDFRSKYPGFYGHLVKVEHIRVFALLGSLVVLCAIFNYLSLYVIRIRMRARELALRLAYGSSRWQMLFLLSTEFLLLLGAACFLGLLFVKQVLPEFKEITHIGEDTSFFFAEMGIYMLVVALGTLPLLLAVTWWMQRQTLNETLHKGMIAVHRNLFRPLAQWVQLAIGIGLVFFTSVVILQLHHLHTKNIAGFNYENRAVVSGYKVSELIEGVTHYLRSHPDVEEVKVGCGNLAYSGNRRIIRDEEGTALIFAMKSITREEADFWGLELLEGRWIENHEKNVALANESAVKSLNLTHPVDTFVQKLRLHIKGVVRNVSAKSLMTPQEPMLYIPKQDKEMEEQQKSCVSFSYRSGSWSRLCDSIYSHFDKEHGNWYIENTDVSFNRLFHSEETLLKLFYVMTVVCILIALFGVYSLITISCEQRRKEIAVRKVFGADMGDILRLFFAEQLVVLVAAALVAFPVAYVCVKPWLEGYIHQVEIPLWLCPAIFAGVTLLVVLCIGWRVWRTAKAHPADEIGKG